MKIKHYKKIIILLLFSTYCHGETVTTEKINGEWWGRMNGRMSFVTKIDNDQIYLPKSAGHYKGKWLTPMPYNLIEKDNKIYSQFKFQNRFFIPEIKMPNRDTLLLDFPEETPAPWYTSPKDQKFTFIRTPTHVEDNHYVGEWTNRRSGFKNVSLTIKPDGTALFFGAVSGVKLCWERDSSSSIIVSLCDDVELNKNTKRLKNFKLILTPTPIYEAIVVDTSKEKGLWSRYNAKSMNWIID